MLLKCASLEEGGTLVAVLNMWLDVLDTLPLVSTKEYTTVSRLMADGTKAPVSFTREGERLSLDTAVAVFDPVILILE